MNILDDLTLIQKFVEGELTLAANQNLRVEPAFGVVQLLTKKAGVLATAKLAGKVRSILVREGATYWQLLNQVLIEQGFIPVAKMPQDFVKFEHHPVPVGYRVNRTEARLLWRHWRRTQQQASIDASKLGLLILLKGSWCPVLEMVFSRELLFIKTGNEEVFFDVAAPIVWLSQVTESLQVEPTVPDLRSTVPESTAPLTQRCPSSPPSRKTSDSIVPAFPPELCAVLKSREGRFYISTFVGEIEVEASDLRLKLLSSNGYPLIDDAIDLEHYSTCC